MANVRTKYFYTVIARSKATKQSQKSVGQRKDARFFSNSDALRRKDFIGDKIEYCWQCEESDKVISEVCWSTQGRKIFSNSDALRRKDFIRDKIEYRCHCEEQSDDAI